MSSLRERLMRLKGGGDAAEPAAGEAYAAVDAAEPAAGAGGEDAWRALGVAETRNAQGTFLLRRVLVPAARTHGRYRLGELPEALPRLAPVSVRQNRSAPKPPPDAAPLAAEQVLFLDLETTGLGVGAGNVPFLIGLAHWEREHLVVEQAFIRHPGEERAALAHLLGRLDGRTHLATFNGRAFDWPLLTGRFILNGWRPVGDGPAHLDLLPPSRALWRHTLPSCRMAVIEEGRLGVAREGDIPGALAPALYFRFLQDGDPTHVAGVFAHNEQDMLTLAALAIHFGRLVGGGADPAETTGWSAEELCRTAAWLDAHGWTERADPLYRELAARQEPGLFRWWLAAAERWKRLGRFDEAVPLWERAAAEAERTGWPFPEAHVQLAMHYEHRLKEPAAALRYAEQALQLVAGSPLAPTGARAAAEREAIRHRVERLRRKCRAAKPRP